MSGWIFWGGCHFVRVMGHDAWMRQLEEKVERWSGEEGSDLGKNPKGFRFFVPNGQFAKLNSGLIVEVGFLFACT